MAHAKDESQEPHLRLALDRRTKLEFHLASYEDVNDVERLAADPVWPCERCKRTHVACLVPPTRPL